MLDFGILPAIALAGGLSIASGINVYAVLVLLGFGSMAGLIEIPSSLNFTTYPLVLFLATLFFIIEFIVDKIPFADTFWDTPHTFIRILLGGFLASQVIGEIDPSLIVAGAFIGAFLASSSHTIKAGTRVVANASPEPFSNIFLSLVEDFLVLGAILLAIKFPMIFLIILVAYILLAIWLIPKIWRGIKGIFKFFNQTSSPQPPKRETKSALENANTKGTLLENPKNPPQLPNN